MSKPDQPSVVITNFVGTVSERLPWLDHIGENLPSIPICVLTDIDDGPTVRAILNKGARGVISPVATGAVVVGALRVLASGGTYIPASALLGSPAGESAATARAERSILRAYPSLSGRQAEVLRLLADGLANQQIAEILQVSPNTVKVHVHNTFKRLGVHRRAEARRLVECAVDGDAAPLKQLGN